MARLILDSGAVIGWSRGNQRVRQLVQRAVTDRVLILIPVAVIAETTRGGAHDAPVNRVIKSVDEIVPVTEAIAREAGRLLAAVTLIHATVDALVVATAMRRESTIILTGDVEDIRALAARYRHVRVERV
jgi:predicted nucleic acid-binding protein